MNNTNSSPFNDWMLLLGIVLLLGLVLYGVSKMMWKIVKFASRRRLRPVKVVDMTNVILLNQYRQKV